MALLGDPWWITTNRGTLNPARLGAPPPVSGGLLWATPRPSTWEPFPSPPLAPRLGWDRYVPDRNALLRARRRGRPWGAWRTTLAATVTPRAPLPCQRGRPCRVWAQKARTPTGHPFRWADNPGPAQSQKVKPRTPAWAWPPGKGRSLSQERAPHGPALLGRITTPEVGGQGSPATGPTVAASVTATSRWFLTRV